MNGRAKILLLIIQVIKKRKYFAFLGMIYFFIFYDKNYKNEYSKKSDVNHFRYIMD